MKNIIILLICFGILLNPDLWAKTSGNESALNGTFEAHLYFSESEIIKVSENSFPEESDSKNLVVEEFSFSEESCSYIQETYENRYINNFSTQGGYTDISNLESGYSLGGYQDNTQMVLTHFAGSVTDFTADFKGGEFGFNIWVDWNQDGQFSENEKVYSSESVSVSTTGSFEVPVSVSIGEYTMRIVGEWQTINPSACGTNIKGGEAEDYTLEVVSPVDCVEPVHLSAVVLDAYSADLSWTDINTDNNSWTVVYGEEGFDPDTQGQTIEVTGDSQTLVTGLNPDKDYEFYVRANCENMNASDWSLPGTFETHYCEYQQTYGGQIYIDSFWTLGGITNISNMNSGKLPGGYQSFAEHELVTYEGGTVNFTVDLVSIYGQYFNIWIDWNHDMQFDENEQFYGPVYGTDIIQGSLFIPQNIDNGSYRMRIVSNGSLQDPLACGIFSGGGEAEDYTLTIIDMPSCIQPEDLTATPLSPYSAHLTWSDPNDLAEQWTILYGIKGFNPNEEGFSVDATGAPEVTIEDLQPDTEYDFYVKTQCSSEEESALGGPHPFRTHILVDCEEDEYNMTLCYKNNSANTHVYTSSDPNSYLDLTINLGQVENTYDQFVVLDTDGTPLYSGFGNNGDISGLNFQSSGPEISIQVIADYNVSCDTYPFTPIDLTVSCSACKNPEFNFVKECDIETGLFMGLIEITDLGTASSLTVYDNQGNPTQEISEPGTLYFGPYPHDFDILITLENPLDPECSITTIINAEGCPPIPCLDAEAYCSGAPLYIDNQHNPPDEPGAPQNFDYGCLGETPPNPSFFYVEIETPGSLTINISQAQSFNEDGNPQGNNLGFGYVGWGPFGSIEEACTNLTVENLIPNSFWGTGCLIPGFLPGNFGIQNAQEGDFYVVLITNLTGYQGIFKIEQIGGSASTVCKPDIENPIVNVSACQGEEATLVSSVDADDIIVNLWSKQTPGSNQYTLIEGEESDSLTVMESGMYKLETFNIEGNVIVEYFRVTFSPKPILDNWEDVIPLCAEDGLVLEGYPSNSEVFETVEYEWMSSTGEVIGNDPTLVVDQVGTYYLLITTYGYSSNGQIATSECTNVYKTEVINPTDINLGEDLMFCDEDSYMLHFDLGGINPDGLEFQWIGTDSNGNTLVASTTTSPNLNVYWTGNYEVYFYFGDCFILSDIHLTFDKTPEIHLDPGQNPCELESVLLDATPLNINELATDLTYVWYFEGEEIPGANTAVLEAFENGEYHVIVITATGCMGEDTVVIEGTGFEMNLGEDQSLCGEDSFTILPNIEGVDSSDADFVWEDEDGSFLDNSDHLTVYESGIYILTMAIGNCTVTDAIIVVFNELPQMYLGEDVITCSLEDIIIDATPLNINPEEAIYEWSLNGVPISDYSEPVMTPIVYGFGYYEVKVYVDDPECSTIDSVYIESIEDFGIVLNIDNNLNHEDLFCQDDEFPVYEIVFTSTLSGLDSEEAIYTWYKNGTEIHDATESSYTVIYDESGVYNDLFALEAQVGNCVVSASLETNISLIMYEHPCKITQGISPKNNDGYNDRLDLTFLNDRSGIERIQIFNRYGSKVFDKRNYTDEWHGQDTKGKELPTGLYYYILEIKNQDPVFGKVVKDWIYINQKTH